MNSVLPLLCLLAVTVSASASMLGDYAVASEDSSKCRACRFIDAVILDFEEQAGTSLRTFLDEKCAMLGILHSKCEDIVDQVVERVEDFGHLLDQDELCTSLLHLCSRKTDTC